MVFGVVQFNYVSPTWLGNTLVAMATKICDFQHKISYVTGIVELADSENHTIEPKITTLSYVQPSLWQIFW